MDATRAELSFWQDAVLGFVGWFLYADFLFGIAAYDFPRMPLWLENLFSALLLAAIWLPALTAPIVLFCRNRQGLWTGILAAALVSIAGTLLIVPVTGIPLHWSGWFIPLPYSWLIALAD